MAFGQYYYLAGAAFPVFFPLVGLGYMMKKWSVSDKVGIQVQLLQSAIGTIVILVPLITLLILIDEGLADTWTDLSTGLGLILMLQFFLWA